MSQPEIQRYDFGRLRSLHGLYELPKIDGGKYVLHSDHLASKQADRETIRGLREALKKIAEMDGDQTNWEAVFEMQAIAQKELEAKKQYEEAAGERTE